MIYQHPLAGLVISASVFFGVAFLIGAFCDDGCECNGCEE